MYKYVNVCRNIRVHEYSTYVIYVRISLRTYTVYSRLADLVHTHCRRFASDTYILYTIGRSCERTCVFIVSYSVWLCEFRRRRRKRRSRKGKGLGAHRRRCDAACKILFCPVLGVFCDAFPHPLHRTTPGHSSPPLAVLYPVSLARWRNSIRTII